MLRRFLKPKCLKTTYIAIDLAFKSVTTYFLYRIYTTLTHSLPIAITNNPPDLDNLNNSIVLEDSQISVGSTDLDPPQETLPLDNDIADTPIDDNNTGIHKRSFWSLGSYLNNNPYEEGGSPPPSPTGSVAHTDATPVASVAPPPPPAPLAATPTETSTPTSSIYMGSVIIN